MSKPWEIFANPYYICRQYVPIFAVNIILYPPSIFALSFASRYRIRSLSSCLWELIPQLARCGVFLNLSDINWQFSIYGTVWDCWLLSTARIRRERKSMKLDSKIIKTDSLSFNLMTWHGRFLFFVGKFPLIVEKIIAVHICWYA